MMTTAVDGIPVSPVRLPGFDYRRIGVEGGATINCAIKGTGPPLLLLHGYPQNHLIWHHVAPALSEHYTVVLTDTRGYGGSDKPPPDEAGIACSKRAMAAAATTRWTSGSGTHQTCAATHCPSAISFPRKRRTWSRPTCATSSTNRPTPVVQATATTSPYVDQGSDQGAFRARCGVCTGSLTYAVP